MERPFQLRAPSAPDTGTRLIQSLGSRRAVAGRLQLVEDVYDPNEGPESWERGYYTGTGDHYSDENLEQHRDFAQNQQGPWLDRLRQQQEERRDEQERYGEGYYGA